MLNDKPTNKIDSFKFRRTNLNEVKINLLLDSTFNRTEDILD